MFTVRIIDDEGRGCDQVREFLSEEEARRFAEEWRRKRANGSKRGTDEIVVCDAMIKPHRHIAMCLNPRVARALDDPQSNGGDAPKREAITDLLKRIFL